MIPVWRRRHWRFISRFVFLLLIFQLFDLSAVAALPKRLVLLLDGVSYRDMKALQAGITYTNRSGRVIYRRAFTNYFPVSRNISTFPSTSDVAWTEMLGDCPLPGYQRTYFSEAANSEVFQNGVTTTMEYEKQMQWQVQSGFRRAMGYVQTRSTFNYEVAELIKNFLNTRSKGYCYYAMLRATDDSQHMGGDIFEILSTLDAKLEGLRARYKKLEGRDLEILIFSDHGNNHAGAGKRVEVRSFLEKAGYRISEFIQHSNDVVLPTVGIESWVEIHNDPSQTRKLVPLLSHLEGADIVTAIVPGRTNQFIVVNSKGDRALIEWNPENNSFRYTTEIGDPLDYLPVVKRLAENGLLDADGFAAADDWMAATLTNRYPLALERIVRGHTRITLDPATILISLKNGYVHAGWLVNDASRLMPSGGTHGALDDVNSDGILLSSFAPTYDTSSSRIAAAWGGFKGLRDYRAEESGAQWFSRKAQTMTMIKRTPLDDQNRCPLPDDGLYLRIWSPDFNRINPEIPVELTIEKTPRYASEPPGRGRVKPIFIRRMFLALPLSFSDSEPDDRVYPFPADLILEPHNIYRATGWVRDGKNNIQLFRLSFRTDNHGKPVPY